MAQKALTPEEHQKTIDLVRRYGSVVGAAKASGIPRGTLQGRWTSASVWAKKNGKPVAVNPATTKLTPMDGFKVSGDVAEIIKTTDVNVRSLEDLIRVCEIDTNEWEVERYTCNKWEMGSVPPVVGSDKAGWIRVDGKPIVTELFQVKAWLRRPDRLTLTLRRLSDDLVADIAAEIKKTKSVVVKYKHVEKGWLFEFPPFDLHAGKYTWSDETVTNFDIDAASDLFNASLDFLLQRALKLSDNKLERILCVFGNDVSHMDSKRGDTTAGTHLDVDTRYIKVYRRICAIHRRAIDVLRGVAPVDVVIVPGNHDELTSFHLGELLTARYEETKHVTIDNSPRLRKYYDFGVNLFGFTHGDSEKISELPLLMAREVPDQWARCSSREWHIGHLHKSEKWNHVSRLEQDIHSDKGVRVRRLAALSAHDAWHVKHGYLDRRACDAFLFHRDAGFSAHFSYNVDHNSGRPMGGQK